MIKRYLLDSSARRSLQHALYHLPLEATEQYFGPGGFDGSTGKMLEELVEVSFLYAQVNLYSEEELKNYLKCQ